MKISTKITDEKAVEQRFHNSIDIKIRKMPQFSQANWIDSDIWLMIRHTHFFCLTWAAQLKFSIGSYYLYGRYVFFWIQTKRTLCYLVRYLRRVHHYACVAWSIIVSKMVYSCFVHLKNGRPAYFQGSFKIRTRKIR